MVDADAVLQHKAVRRADTDSPGMVPLKAEYILNTTASESSLLNSSLMRAAFDCIHAGDKL
jgi:uncharacterized protein YfdQ (DUF2303 family)